MHFTVVFPGGEDVDLSVGLVFIPGPCWIRPGPRPSPGEPALLVNMADRPDYRRGGVRRLLDAVPEIAAARRDPGTGPEVVVVAHRGGHGTAADLAALQDDLRENAFKPVTVQW